MNCMKRKQLLCAFLSLLIFLTLFLPAPAAAADLYFTAVNDNILPLTADTMPVWSNRTLYVPYSVFDQSSTGINLDIYCSYSRNENTVTLLNLKKILVFDLNSGECRDDLTGETYSAQAIIRNNRPYLPVAAVCSFFGLTYSYNTISQGYLVRIKSSAVILSDAKLIDSGQNLINLRLRDYNQSIAPSTDPGYTNPSVSPAPPVSPSEPDDKNNPSSTSVRTYLAFRCEQSEGIAGILDTLDANNLCGLFLFTPQTLEPCEDLVRRILGTGHSIGLLAEGGTLEQTKLLLEQGQTLLQSLHYTRATIACVPKEQRSTLENEGWVCWSSTFSLSPGPSSNSSAFAANTLHRLEGRTYSTYLSLPASLDTKRVLPALLHQLDTKNFVVSVPMETRL